MPSLEARAIGAYGLAINFEGGMYMVGPVGGTQVMVRLEDVEDRLDALEEKLGGSGLE